MRRRTCRAWICEQCDHVFRASYTISLRKAQCKCGTGKGSWYVGKAWKDGRRWVPVTQPKSSEPVDANRAAVGFQS